MNHKAIKVFDKDNKITHVAYLYYKYSNDDEEPVIEEIKVVEKMKFKYTFYKSSIFQIWLENNNLFIDNGVFL